MADNGENRQSIGERLLALRNKNNLTQEELAERLMVSRQSVSKWELSKTLPDVDKLIQLSEMYQVSMDYLIIGKRSGADAGEQETAQPCEEVSERKTEGEPSVQKSLESAGNGEVRQDYDSAQRNQDALEDGPMQENGDAPGDEDMAAQEIGDASGDVAAQENALGEGRKQESAKKNGIDRLIRRSSLLLSMLLSGVLCVCLLFFSGRLFMTQVYTTEGKKQDLAQVERVYEQYTKADVTFFNEDGFFVNKSVWLDIPGVREDDYVYYYYDGEDTSAYFFEYYMQTLLLPLIAGIICLIFFITFCMEWRNTR